MHGFTENYIKVGIPYNSSLLNRNPAGDADRMEQPYCIKL